MQQLTILSLGLSFVPSGNVTATIGYKLSDEPTFTIVSVNAIVLPNGNLQNPIFIGGLPDSCLVDLYAKINCSDIVKIKRIQTPGTTTTTTTVPPTTTTSTTTAAPTTTTTTTAPVFYKYLAEPYVCTSCASPPGSSVIVQSTNPSLTLFKYYIENPPDGITSYKVISPTTGVATVTILNDEFNSCGEACDYEPPPDE